MDSLFGATVFIGLYFGICYLGFLANHKKGQTFTQFMAHTGDFLQPLEDDLRALDRGQWRQPR